MTDIEQTDAPAVGGSVLDAVRERRQKAEKRKHITLPVPGWDGGLCVRYRVIDPAASQRAQRALNQLQAGESDELAAALQTLCEVLAVACVEMFGRGDDDELVPIREALGGDLAAIPVRYDQRLCDAVGITPEKQTEGAVVKAVFSDNDGHLNVVALTTHAERIGDWMADTSRPVENEILGN